MANISIDEIDLKLISLLQKDGKMKIKELANALNMTSSPIFERIKKLENDGFITGYHAEVNQRKLGFQLIAFCSVTLDNHHKPTIEMFEKDVKTLSEIMECYHIAGQFDYLLKIVVVDMESFQRFLTEKLAILENIRRVQSSFVMTGIKNTHHLPIEEL